MFFDRSSKNVKLIMEVKNAPDISDFADRIKFRGYLLYKLLIKSGAEFRVLSNNTIDKLTGKPVIRLEQIK